MTQRLGIRSLSFFLSLTQKFIYALSHSSFMSGSHSGNFSLISPQGIPIKTACYPTSWSVGPVYKLCRSGALQCTLRASEVKPKCYPRCNATKLFSVICTCKKCDGPTLTLFVLIVDVSDGQEVVCNHHTQPCRRLNCHNCLCCLNSLLLYTNGPL